MRILLFINIIIFIAFIEFWFSLRSAPAKRGANILSNFILLFFCIIISTISVKNLPILSSYFSASKSFGIFNVFELGFWSKLLLSYIVLDYALYFQHYASHKIPFLWRFHKVHHSDTLLDFSTGVRFHPGEIILSTLWKSLVVLAFGIPIYCFVLFEIFLNSASLLSHGNYKIHLWLDRVLSLVLVTPNIHQIHHHIDKDIADHNFGFVHTLWDRIFGTFHRGQVDPDFPLGIADNIPHKKSADLLWMPFKK